MIHQTRRPRTTGRAAALLVASVQLPLVELIVAASQLDPRYSFLRNTISDLALPECISMGQRSACATLWPLMAASFVFQALAVLTALASLRVFVPARWRRIVTFAALAHGAGLLLVAAVPDSPDGAVPWRFAVHAAGAIISILAGNLLALFAGAALRRRSRTWATASMLLGAAGLLISLAVAPFAGPGILGVVERATVYPIIAWLVMTGICLAVSGAPLPAATTTTRPMGRP